MQEVWLKEVVFLAGATKVEFLAGALAPPRPTLRALASQDRCRRQDVQGMLKYTMHEVQFRAGASPALPVRPLDQALRLERRTKMATACPRAGRGHRTRCRCPRRRS